MTKEEIIQAISDDKMMPFIQPEQLSQIVAFVINNYQPSLPSNLDEAANNYGRDIRLGYPRVMDETDKYICNAFKASAEWYDNQMKMPNSSELISAWRGVKSILQEKDFRGDEWRLAYNAFMFGFSRGINTQKTEK